MARCAVRVRIQIGSMDDACNLTSQEPERGQREQAIARDEPADRAQCIHVCCSYARYARNSEPLQAIVAQYYYQLLFHPASIAAVPLRNWFRAEGGVSAATAGDSRMRWLWQVRWPSFSSVNARASRCGAG